MYSGLNARSNNPFAVRKLQDEARAIPTPTLPTSGFNIWWQKTFAQHTAMAAEAYALMRADRRVSSAGLRRHGESN
jgi:hypothetical protein